MSPAEKLDYLRTLVGTDGDCFDVSENMRESVRHVLAMLDIFVPHFAALSGNSEQDTWKILHHWAEMGKP